MGGEVVLKTEYNGYIIAWNDYGRFSINRDGENLKGNVATVAECQAWIDAKNKQKFRRVPILMDQSSGWNAGNGIVSGEATSVIDDASVWVAIKGKRSKERMESIYADIPANREKAKRIADCLSAVVAAESEIKKHFSEMVRIKADDLKA